MPVPFAPLKKKMNKEIISFIKNQFESRDFIALHEPVFRGNEKKYLIECIDSTYVSSVGPFVDKFESLMSQITGIKILTNFLNL